ncbi:MAG: ubiquinol-cytochrome c reductase iron-sulfur subunit [Oscillatoria princeps RMCB-10]|jgi:cytochrome b6-f complex iron-sulfur subunit|nr:ubiquinol-cytochrome c reductase iron-sulfur subunit [Oscillatoria princeps RMCB-10]
MASSLPVVIAACSPDSTTTAKSPQNTPPAPAATTPPAPAATTPRADGFVLAGTVAELDKEGKIQNKKLPVLVVRNPADSKTLYAVDPTCTHKGCPVEWEADEKLFDCPCHDSDFAPDGKVVKGPAAAPLKTYQVKIEGDSVLVKAG